MILEVLLVVALLALLAVLFRARIKRRMFTGALVVQWLVLFVAVLVTALGRQAPVEVEVIDRPVEVHTDGYVSSDSCGTCHPDQYATWHTSYHRTMTQVASPESVIGDFDSVRLTDRGRTYRLDRVGKEFWVETPPWIGPDGKPKFQRHQIALTTGSHHMQVCWYSIQHGRTLELLPFTYLKDEQRWIPNAATFLYPEYQTAAPSHNTGSWNAVCVDCHTTHGQSRVFIAPERNAPVADSRVAEFGIACEACHGPGRQHVQRNRSLARRYRYHLNDQPDSTIVHPARLSSRLSSQVCGRCHSIRIDDQPDDTTYRVAHGSPYRPGDELSKVTVVVQCSQKPFSAPLQRVLKGDPKFLERKFWSDGMVRVSGREYNGLIESPCFQRGEKRMSCLSCHLMHLPAGDVRTPREWANDQLKSKMRGNLACLQCHHEFEDESRLTSHTHHAAGSSGSTCYNCHMSYTTYGLFKAIRSHQIDSPDVSTSLKTGRPNACNQCHLDKTMYWAADHLSDWYGLTKPELTEDESAIAASVLWLLRGDAGQRALMAWSYGWKSAQDVSGTEWMGPYLAQLLDDPYAPVRFIAYRSLRKLPEFDKVQHDFVGPSANRSEARRQVLDIWNRRSGKPNAAQLLLDSGGALRQDEFVRLLKQRDDRPVILDE